MTTPYAVQWDVAALRRFRKLPPDVQARLAPAIAALANDPRPPGCKRLKGTPDQWPIRVGDYRVIYRIEDDRLLVTIVRVGHRSEIYD